MLLTLSKTQKKSHPLFSQKFFWLKELSKEITETSILPDFIRTRDSYNTNNCISFKISNDFSQKIIQLSNGSNLSIYLVLLANLNILLHKYTGNNHIIIGSPSYINQDKEEFINQVIPLRTNVKTQISFKNLLCETKLKLIEAYSNSHYPLDELIKFLNLQYDSNRHPLFDIVISLENIHNSQLLADICTDFHISFVVSNNSIQGRINYNKSLFREVTIKNIIQSYLHIIEITINNINIKVADIPLVNENQKSLLLEIYHQNYRDYPVTQSIFQLFEKQVELTPQHTAAIFGNHSINYQKLNECANQVARHLIQLGVSKGSFVGIIKKRDINFLIAIIAILKVGGVYVPIDSTYPPDRIKYMLLNSETKTVLTDAACLDILADVAENCQYLQSLVCLDIKLNNRVFPTLEKINIYDQLDLELFPTNNLDIEVDGIDQAYMIYTSGSTGLPKGAIIRHGGAINHIYAQYEALQLPEKLVFLQSAPASSDISVWQFLAPILIGGKTVIIDTETVCHPERLFQVLQQEKITIAELVPVVLKNLLDYISDLSHQEKLLPDLRWMMVTGESATVEIVNQWLNYYPAIPVVNAYGPTEAADDITQFIIDKPLAENQRTVSIGKPLANLHLYILDQKMQLLPVGFPGEICVSGYGVGKGYWKNEESTKLSFVTNPFPSTTRLLPGTNTDFIYKTGDLGRWLPDGNIEFLGRIDHQVKIRGFRIELGEIETLLNQHPLVRENVVIAREDVPNHKRLVAYIVVSVEDNQLVAQLRNLLKERLPEYMIPSAFVLLEKLPLTPSGKIDRKGLPAPDTQDSDLAASFVAPRTTVEETLAGIWEQVLGIERVGIHDNFFELGGDSILCIQVIAKARQTELNITPKQLFQHQTIAELAKNIGTSQATLAEQGLVTGIVPLTPIQHYFFEQNLLNPHHWNEAVLLEVIEPMKPQLLERVVQQLLVHHDALRLRFEQTESGWKQINLAPEDNISFSYIDLSTLPPIAQLPALEKAATEIQASLNLSQGSLVRVVLFNLGAEQTNRLLIVIHHLLVDSLSWRILIEDLQTAYQQLNRDEEIIKLPAKTTSFQQWSQQLQDYANSALVQQELSYWLTESRTQVSPIPVDYPRGDNTEALACTVSVTLGVAETQILLKEVPIVYRTQINEVLLTGLVQAFSQWTGKKSLLVDLESHGREDIADEVDLSRTVGLFSSIYPVLLNLGESSEPQDNLRIIKEQLRSIPNRGIGYGMLRYLSHDPEVNKSLKSLPTAEVVFNYLGQFDQTLSESSRLRLAQEPIGPQSSLENNRRYLISFNSFVVDSQLQINCTYSQAIFQRKTIEDLSDKFIQSLLMLIAYYQSGDINGFTPSDFPLAQLSQDDLDAALAMVEF
ncbi:amino acid adenylation domain-containing protein [Chlorogloeopsis sp. ULAP02]|uniref:amino acid adenylation domain-containing protein n=1 Tax=Chlorogloeopsis sp. ULAP02 TaxID=3107926 RepID=UPI003136ADBF